MKTANVHEAKTTLSKLLDAAAAGEDVFITRNGARFRLVQMRPERRDLFGSLAGQVRYPHGYDAAFGPDADAEVQAMFEDGP